jgi:endo-1,3(4)-beta-glucanase
MTIRSLTCALLALVLAPLGGLAQKSGTPPAVQVIQAGRSYHAIVTGPAGARVLLVGRENSSTPGSSTFRSKTSPAWVLGTGVLPATQKLVLPIQAPAQAGGYPSSLLLTAFVNGYVVLPPTTVAPLGGAASVEVMPAPGQGTSLLGGPALDSSASPWPEADHSLQPSALWGQLSTPLPTNRWWQNLTLGNGGNTINSLPYLLRLNEDGVHACKPQKTFGPTYIFTAFVPNLSLGATETLSNRRVIDFDDLSVTVKWSDPNSSMIARVVRGMPYVTAQYAGYTPEIETIHAVLSVNGINAPQGSVHTNTRFEFFLNNGQTWVLYASGPISLTLDTLSRLSASGPFTGALRTACQEPGMEAVLDQHFMRIPTGGKVQATAMGDEAIMTFDWESVGAGPLLMMTLPHHRDILVSPSLTGLVTDTIKGPMIGAIGNRWFLREQLTTIEWTAPSPIDPAREADIRTALAGDTGQAVVSADTYFGGKQLAKLGRLALIADQLGETALATTYRNNLAAAFQPWLDGTNPQSLVYDRTYGGIVDSTAINNPAAGFGQGYYNDHHFHYGYFIYAAAALARGDSAWAATNEAAILHLVRDIANPTAADPAYTKMRQMDWFAGHSWAAGLFEFGDSRNQESTSEAVNGWYAVYLWGLVTNDERLEDLGRLMLASEIRCAKRYWQIPSSNTLYPPPFADNKVVGVLWGLKVEYATFFGNNPEFIHGIQMLPFTPISEELLDPQWIQEGYSVFSSNIGGAGEGWKGFIYMAHSIFDNPTAWQEANTLMGYDDGNSKTNTLYFIATRP